MIQNLCNFINNPHHQNTYMINKQSQQSTPTKQAPIFPPLKQFFEDDNIAWRLIDIEASLYAECSVSIDQVTELISIYMKFIEQLNSRQDQRQGFFTSKMQKLMAEPYVNRCFNNNLQKKGDVLESRRKKMEQALEQVQERTDHKQLLKQVLTSYSQKQQKAKQKIDRFCYELQENLSLRIKQRKEQRRTNSSSKKNSQSSINESSIKNQWEEEESRMDEDRLFRKLRWEVEEEQHLENLEKKHQWD